MSSAPTIPSLKQRFLAMQTSLLAQPVAPSSAWRASNDASEHPIPNRLIDDAVANLNHTIQQHCRRVYAPQASRNIAEQISNSYSRDAERRVGLSDDAEGGIGRELDLADEGAIEILPSTWPSAKDINAYPVEANRFTESVRRLGNLNKQRKDLRRRIQRLQHLHSIIEPLRATEVGGGVQENLATRNGPIEMELEKMLFLLARVAGRVSELPDARESQGGGNIELNGLAETSKKNIDEFLASPHVFPS